MRRLITALLMSSLVLVAAGCGSDDEEAPGENAQENATTNNDTQNNDDPQANDDPQTNDDPNSEEGPTLDLPSTFSLSAEVGQQVEDSVSVSNTGDAGLTVDFDVQDDWLELEPLELSLDAGETQDLTLRATCPDEEGQFDAEVAVATNDTGADGSTLTVSLTCEPGAFGSVEINLVGLPSGAAPTIALLDSDGESAYDIAGEGLIDEVDAGDYTVVPEAFDDDGAVYVAGEQSISVESGETTQVDVEYEVGYGAVEVSVDGLPGGVEHQLELVGDESYQVPQDGVIADVFPGSYTLEASDVEDGLATYVADDVADIMVTSDETTDVDVTYEVVTADLSVEIEGLPSGVDADVDVVGGELDETISATTSFNDILPGEYTIAANDVDDADASYRSSSQTVEIESGDELTVTVEYVEVPGTLEITIGGLDIEGLAEADANVTVSGANFDADITAAGTTTLNDVPPGSYDLIVADAVQGPATFVGDDVTAEVGSDATTSVTIEYEVVLGNLHVDATGLPDGLEMAADIEGPDFSESIDEPTNFSDLLPGDYTVDFSAQTTGDLIYDPDPSEADFTVESGTTTDAIADYSIRPGTLDINVNIPDSIEVNFSVDDGGISVHDFTANGPMLESVDLEPGNYEITTDGTMEDEWGNEFIFHGTDTVIAVESGGSHTRSVSTQTPTEVTTEDDDIDEYGSLRAVIDRVNPDSEITFADDIGEIALDEMITIDKPLSLLGNTDSEVVITESDESPARLFEISLTGDEDEDDEVLIQDLVFEDSRTAFRVNTTDADVTFFGTEFRDNQATSFGGAAIYVWSTEGTNVVIRDSHFHGNTTSDSSFERGGGALRVFTGSAANPVSVRVQDSTFDGNQSQHHGGAIWIDAVVELELEDVTLENNTAGANGGAVYSRGGSVNTERVVAVDNSAEDEGGAFWLHTGTIEESHFKDNVANLYGGAIFIYEEGARTNLRRSLFEGNRTTINNAGGGAVLVDGHALISNSTFSGNIAEEGIGGAVRVNGEGNVNIQYSTMIDNDSQFLGRAIGGYPGSNIRMRGNFVVDNGSTAMPDVGTTDDDNPIISQGYNVIGRVPEGLNTDLEDNFDYQDTDILNDPDGFSYQPLADNGGFTETYALDEGSDGYLDIGANECRRLDLFLNRMTDDQRGEPRPAGAHCSRGALEVDAHAERFVDVDLPDEFGSGSFEGAGGLTWEYSEARAVAPITPEGSSVVMESVGASISTTVPGGAKSLSFFYRKYGSSDELRQIRVLVDGSQVRATDTFGDFNGFVLGYSVLEVEDLDLDDDFELTIENSPPGGEGAVQIDNITWH